MLKENYLLLFYRWLYFLHNIYIVLPNSRLHELKQQYQFLCRFRLSLFGLGNHSITKPF